MFSKKNRILSKPTYTMKNIVTALTGSEYRHLLFCLFLNSKLQL